MKQVRKALLITKFCRNLDSESVRCLFFTASDRVYVGNSVNQEVRNWWLFVLGQIHSQVFLIVYLPMFRVFTTVSCKTEVINFGMSVSLSVCRSVCQHQQLHDFMWNFMKGISTQNCLHVSPWLKFNKNQGCYVKTCMYFWVNVTCNWLNVYRKKSFKKQAAKIGTDTVCATRFFKTFCCFKNN